MNVLVINAGSSSLKYQLLNVETKTVIAKGICERVGSPDSFIKYESQGEKKTITLELQSHDEAVHYVLTSIIQDPFVAIDELSEIDAVGHRIVQGGKYFDQSVLITDEVVQTIEDLAEIAPLHNKPAIMGIKACQHHMPHTPMVAVFDSAYFQTLPQYAYTYPIPYDLSEKYSLRKYGAHGTSHKYIAQRAAIVLDRPLTDLKLVTCHLGNGCSLSAIDHGTAVDTTMGLSPLDGLMMGTRCGAIDPSVVTFLMDHENYTPDEMLNILNKKSGLLGVSGISNDLRAVKEASENGHVRAQLAYDMFSYTCKKYIGQYVYAMGGVDAIVLTAGIGENCEKMRRMIFSGLQPLGIILDEERNKLHGFERIISADSSKVKIIVIPTDEEYMIASDTYDIVSQL